VVLGLIGMI